MEDDQPRYKHDCDTCTFLGRHGEADLYFCMQHGTMPTVIARFGAGADYTSGLLLADVDPYLAEARARAHARGLLPERQS